MQILIACLIHISSHWEDWGNVLSVTSFVITYFIIRMLGRCHQGVSSYPVTIPGHVGVLEGRVDCTASGEPQGCAVIFHTHTLYGGSMHNKVAHTLAK